MAVRFAVSMLILVAAVVSIALISTMWNPPTIGRISSAEANARLQSPASTPVLGAAVSTTAADPAPTATMRTPAPTGNASAQPTPTRDPAMRIPGIAVFAAQHPTDWEQRLHPGIRNMVAFQRMIGEHATVIYFSDEEPNPGYTNPKVLVGVMDWDGADLFTAGVPRFHGGKPVDIHFSQGPIQAAPLTSSPTPPGAAASPPSR